MRNIYVVTHTEATHHRDGLVGGWFDSALTEQGRSEAERLADEIERRVAGGRVALFCSDLLRTRETAVPIAARLGVEPVLDLGLRERSYGVADGQPVGTHPIVLPPADGDRLHHDEGNGSETRHTWATRAYAAFDRALAANTPATVIVSHGGTATYLLAAWIGIPLDAAGLVWFTVHSGAITHLREDDDFHSHTIVSLNDRRHLDLDRNP
jgi:probable phosphoglycerate mutase